MNDLSRADEQIVDRLNAELAAVPVPPRRPLAPASAAAPWPTVLVITALVLAIGIGAARLLRAPTTIDVATQPPAPIATTTPAITSGSLEVKTQATILSIAATSFVGRITNQNFGDQRVWNDRIVAIYVTDRTVYPNLGADKLANAKLKTGDTVTLTFVPADYDSTRGAYPALVVGREAVVSASCPATTSRDASGVITSGGELGLIEIHPASYPGEQVVVLVYRGAGGIDALDLRADNLGVTRGASVMWSTPPTPRTTAWGSVVFEVNTKPIGNVGCWHLVRNGGPTNDPGIVIDLGR